MFSFANTERITRHPISDARLPMSLYVGEQLRGGYGFSGGAALQQLGERFGSWLVDDPGRKLTPDELRKNMGLPGLEWQDREYGFDEAVMLYNRHRERQDHEAMLMASQGGAGRSFLGFGAAMLGSTLHPVDMVLTLLPVSGQAKLARAAVRAGVPQWRARMAAGVVAEERLATMFGARVAPYAAASINGAVGNAIVEPFVFADQTLAGFDYSLSDTAKNVAAGALFGPVFTGIARGLGRLADSTRERMATKMLQDALQGADHPDGSIHADIDPAVVHRINVEALAKAEKDIPVLEALLQRPATHGGAVRLNADDVVEVLRRRVEADGKRGDTSTEAAARARVLERVESGERGLSVFQQAAALVEVEYHPSAADASGLKRVDVDTRGVRKSPPQQQAVSGSETQRQIAAFNDQISALKAELGATKNKAEQKRISKEITKLEAAVKSIPAQPARPLYGSLPVEQRAAHQSELDAADLAARKEFEAKARASYEAQRAEAVKARAEQLAKEAMERMGVTLEKIEKYRYQDPKAADRVLDEQIEAAKQGAKTVEKPAPKEGEAPTQKTKADELLAKLAEDAKETEKLINKKFGADGAKFRDAILNAAPCVLKNG